MTMQSKRVYCDFDNTISEYDVTDAILEKFADPSWEAVEEEWLAGKITARECMEKQISLIRASREELDSLLDEAESVPEEGYVEAAGRIKLYAKKTIGKVEQIKLNH